MLQWEVVFVPPARIKRTARDGQGHMCEIKSSGCNICLYRVFSAGFALDLRMTTTEHLLKVRLCSPGSQSQHPIPKGMQLPQNGPRRAPGWVPGGTLPALALSQQVGPAWSWKSPRGLLALVRNACMCPPGGGVEGDVCPSHWGHP